VSAPDYRNRPPVDTSRPDPLKIVGEAGAGKVAAIVAVALLALVSLYGVAVAAGLAW